MMQAQNRATYGSGTKQFPATPGRRNTPHMESIYLGHLLPLEDYDKIIVLFSGGKDSLACILDLLERGVPRNKMELWHHDIDGGHPTRYMDWPVTQNYVRAVAEYLGISLRTSWRVNGFFGELYRIGASWPVRYDDPETGAVLQCRLSKNQIRSAQLREKILNDLEWDELERIGQRLKFPAKSSNLDIRWCSSILKITVADTVIRNLEELKGYGQRMKFPAKGSCRQGRWCSGSLKAQVEGTLYTEIDEMSKDTKILVVSGERRQESSGRAKYNEMELHRTNATAKAHRLVHQWRSVIDWDEAQIWDIIRRYRMTPHPCYAAGWNRCSCMMCIFSLPTHWAGIRELFPERFAEMEEDERLLGFTIDNKKSLAEYVGPAKSCVCHNDPKAIQQLITGDFSIKNVETPVWTMPAGAFHGAGGGPC